MATLTNPPSSSSASSSPFSANIIHRRSPRPNQPSPSSFSIPTTALTPSTPSKRRIHESTLADDEASNTNLMTTASTSQPSSSNPPPSAPSNHTSTSSSYTGSVEAGTEGSSSKKRQKQLAEVEEGEEKNEEEAPSDVKTTSDGRVVKMLPHEYMQTDQEDLVILIASMLVKLIQHNDQVPLLPEHLTRFHSRSPPSISVEDYLRRIVKYTNIEKSPLLLLLPYLDAFCQHLPSFTLSSLTVHRFLISSACVASKALCDSFCTNAHYAKVGGIRVEELNLLERELVGGLGWKLVVQGSLLQDYYTSLISAYAFSPPPPPSSTATPSLAYSQGPPLPPKASLPPPFYLPWPSWEECETLHGRPKAVSHPLPD